MVGILFLLKRSFERCCHRNFPPFCLKTTCHSHLGNGLIWVLFRCKLVFRPPATASRVPNRSPCPSAPTRIAGRCEGQEARKRPPAFIQHSNRPAPAHGSERRRYWRTRPHRGGVLTAMVGCHSAWRAGTGSGTGRTALVFWFPLRMRKTGAFAPASMRGVSTLFVISVSRLSSIV